MERWNWHSPLGRGQDAESSLGITSPGQTGQSSDTNSEAPGPSHFLSVFMAQFSEAKTEGWDLRKPVVPGGTEFGKALRLSNYPAFLLLLLLLFLLLRELGRWGAPSSCIGLPSAPSLRAPCPRSLVPHLTHLGSSLSSPNLDLPTWAHSFSAASSPHQGKWRHQTETWCYSCFISSHK